MRTTPGAGTRSTGIRAATAAATLVLAGALALAPAPVASAASAEMLPPAPSCVPLHVGSRGICVRSLEGQLQIMHYDLSRPDTIFGPQTARAVVAFQKVNGMRRTGIVTAEVWQRMFYAPKLPRLRYIRSGRGVEVNLSKQVMLRAKHGRLVRIYDVSTGRSSLPTPVSGAAPFHIWRRKLWGLTGWTDSSGTRHHYVNYFKRGTLLAIHAYAYVPPYPASDGCIRVPPGSARRLWWTLHLRERVYTYN